jgi:hypothetical protein
MISKALEVFGDRVLVGYDIGCRLSSTIRRSSLAVAFSEKSYRCCVNAFHGYAHNYGCQRKNHPLYIEGTGLEDLETMERIFSASNSVARLTRHASPFNRRMFIDMHFNQWDEDKYLNLGTMLYNNYRQAIYILTEDAQAMNETLATLGISEEVLALYISEESEYIDQLGKEPEWNLHSIVYVELLQEYEKLQ